MYIHGMHYSTSITSEVCDCLLYDLRRQLPHSFSLTSSLTSSHHFLPHHFLTALSLMEFHTHTKYLCVQSLKPFSNWPVAIVPGFDNTSLLLIKILLSFLYSTISILHSVSHNYIPQYNYYTTDLSPKIAAYFSNRITCSSKFAAAVMQTWLWAAVSIALTEVAGHSLWLIM